MQVAVFGAGAVGGWIGGAWASAGIEVMMIGRRAVAEEIGAGPWLRLPERNAAERQIARHAEGASFAEIYAEQVGLTVPTG